MCGELLSPAMRKHFRKVFGLERPKHEEGGGLRMRQGGLYIDEPYRFISDGRKDEVLDCLVDFIQRAAIDSGDITEAHIAILPEIVKIFFENCPGTWVLPDKD